VAETVGIRHHGFAESPIDPMTMMITLADVEKAMGIARD
jgi:hypothetical protein